MSYYTIILIVVLIASVYFLRARTPSSQFQKNIASLTKQAQRLFGYNIKLMLHPSSSNPSRACIFLHGFCGHRKQLKPSLLDDKCSLIAFNFPDASPKRFFWRSSLGQLNEVKIAAFVVHAAYRAGFSHISLYGVSRGGAVALNLMRFFLDEAYEQERLSIGITSHETQSIGRILKKSLIVLQVPLTDSNKAIKIHFDRVGHFYPRSEAFLERVNQRLQSWSYHQKEGMQAFESAQWLVEHQHYFSSVWYQALNDKVVCNHTMQQTFECFYRVNPQHTLWHTGPGGHNTDPDRLFYESLLF